MPEAPRCALCGGEFSLLRERRVIRCEVCHPCGDGLPMDRLSPMPAKPAATCLAELSGYFE
jgi:hypothetical protein